MGTVTNVDLVIHSLLNTYLGYPLNVLHDVKDVNRRLVLCRSPLQLIIIFFFLYNVNDTLQSIVSFQIVTNYDKGCLF